MRLIFIRHGDPDYEHDALTEKGVREAKLLAGRVSTWDVEKFYVSPLGRAQQTASYTLEKMGRTAKTMDWLREFSYAINTPETGYRVIPWDLFPDYFTTVPEFYDKDKWLESDIVKSSPEMAAKYHEVCAGIDSILQSSGYERHGLYYRTDSAVTDGDDNKNVVLFCHFGVTSLIISYLLGISPILLWQGFIAAPTSITVLNAEKRLNDDAYFRIQSFGDASHLTVNGEPISGSGNFAEPFQQ